MMKINLRNNWFGPEETFYRAANNPIDFPDDWIDVLPSTATFADGANQGKRVGDVRDHNKGRVAQGVVEPLPELTPPPSKESATAVGGVDGPVMQGVKDTLSPPPTATPNDRPPNPPSLAQAAEQSGQEPAEGGPPKTAPAKPATTSTVSKK